MKRLKRAGSGNGKINPHKTIVDRHIYVADHILVGRHQREYLNAIPRDVYRLHRAPLAGERRQKVTKFQPANLRRIAGAMPAGWGGQQYPL